MKTAVFKMVGVLAILGAIAGFVLQIFGHLFAFFAVIPLFFILLGCSNFLLSMFEKTLSPNKLFLLFFVMKFVKMLLSIALLILYAKFFGAELLLFAATFFLFYIIYLLLETFTVLKFLKKKNG